ncbi:hypothetical protein MW887_003406 [Aspergillus wentii]|nr:hypothetical protein MW887_003406 [Aspergillus wentii]
MRCRVRRRKCDETKPRCRNCIEKNFTCQYGPKLTFLQKNAFTVTPAEIPKPASAAYDAIQFVNEDPQSYRDATWDEASDTSIHPPSDSATPRPKNPDTLDAPADLDDVSNLTAWPPDTSNNPPAIFSDGDESAVQGLLALGNTAETSVLSNISDFAGLDTPRLNPSRSVYSDQFSHRVSNAGVSITDDSIISQTRILQLLRHYRYEVASWSFGIPALQMAMLSKATLSALLNLSEISFNLLHRVNSYESVSGHISAEDEDMTMNITSKALLSAFQTVHFFISNVPRAWANPPKIDLDLLSNLELHASEMNINSAVYWLFLRLDLSVALATDTSITIPLPMFPAFSPSDIDHADSGRVFHLAHIPLFLCAKALQFCNDETQPSHRRTDNWMSLVDQLEQWYHHRSQEFHPMLELDLHDPSMNTDGSFPLILFTNGAGIFGNQLYHTAMLLLLLNRPRTARHVGLQPSAMSPLWHARRICSIALNNDRRECWDLSLLASFLVAARRMTHEFQQQEILHGFDQIRTVTGWDISKCLGNLREEWGIHDS